MSSRANYGIDSPAIVASLFLFGLIGLSGALVLRLFFNRHPFLEVCLVVAGAYFLLGAGGMLRYSKTGKLHIRDQLLTLVPWRGDEIVLDVGCGRGLLLIGAAQRIPKGKAIGLDLWIPGALSGNRPGAVLQNARLEGVLDRVAVTRGDIQQLPFADGSFDVVVSNFVVHELNTQSERAKMLGEIVRVLKPGGSFALVDFIFTTQCVDALRATGINNVRRVRVGSFFSFWFTAILNFGLVQTYAVLGSKA